MTTEESVKECFRNALKDEEKGKKHKGLLVTKPDENEAKVYIKKAEDCLDLCDIYKKGGYDYKIPEEWYYSLYYCSLAILAKFGIESRSQRCSALFIRYLKEKNIIDYDYEFIERITVHREKSEKSDVDEREKARYGPFLKMKDVIEKYDAMIDMCKRAISQCKDIVYSNKKFEIPKELFD